MRLFLTNLHFASSRIKNDANNVSFLLKSFDKIGKLNEKMDKSQKKIKNNNKVLKNGNLLKLKTARQQKNLFNEINNNIESLEKLNLDLDQTNPSTIETDLTDSNLKNVSVNHPLDDCDYDKVNALYGYKNFTGYNDGDKDIPCTGVRWQSKTPCEEQVEICGYKNKLQCVSNKVASRVKYNYKHREARKKRVREHIKKANVSERPRLSIFISNKYIYAQVIDDKKGITIASASTAESSLKHLMLKPNIDGAKEIGRLISQRLIEAGITKIVFDRGSRSFHGRIKALAEAARESGLDF